MVSAVETAAQKKRDAKNKYMREYSRRNKDRIRRRYHERLAHDLDFAERERCHDRARTRRYRLRHPERARELSRARAATLRKNNPISVRAASLKYWYGITAEQFMAICERQGNACAICHQEAKTLNVDHEHATGLVRGLLCRNCNWLLGNAKDDPARLEAAAQYLRATITHG
jgi:hypothetical protein